MNAFDTLQEAEEYEKTLSSVTPSAIYKSGKDFSFQAIKPSGHFVDNLGRVAVAIGDMMGFL